MKKKYLKMILDIFMLLAIVLFYNKLTVSMKFHEIGGLIICGIFLIHIGLNLPWVKGVSKRILSKKLPLKTRIAFVVNVLLLICFFMIAVSGVMISKTILVEISSRAFNWKNIHYFASSMSIVLLGIHIGLHASYMSAIIKKYIKGPKQIYTAILIVFMIATVSYGVYNVVSSGFTKWMSIPFTASSEIRSNSREGRNTLESQEDALRTDDEKSSTRGTERSKGRGERSSGDSREEGTSTYNTSMSFTRLVHQATLFGSMILTFAIFTAGIERLIKRV